MDHMNHMYRHRVHGTTHFSGNFTCTITSFFTKKFLHYIVVLKSFLTLAVVPCASRLNSFSFSLSLSVCLSLSLSRESSLEMLVSYFCTELGQIWL